jgi:hypothetical protein
LAYAYAFPSALDVSGYSASMVIYAGRGGASLFTVTSTPTAAGSFIEFDGQSLEVRIVAADIDDLPESDDVTQPSLLQYDVFLTSVDLTEKLTGGLFRVMPVGSQACGCDGDVTVTLGDCDITIELTGARGVAGITVPVSTFMESFLLDETAPEARADLGITPFMGTVLDDADAAAARTTLEINQTNLGVSSFMQTVLDDTTAAAARITLGADLASNATFIASGTGAINRDVQSKLRERVGPTEYGADGTADITALYLANNANSQIFVAGGSYDVNTPFTLGAGKTLVMDPAALFTGASKFSTGLEPGAAVEGHKGGADEKTRFWIKSMTGTVTPGAGVFSSFTSGYEFFVSSDDRDVGSDFSVGVRIRHYFGGAAAGGGRNALTVALLNNAATKAGNTQPNYAAIQALNVVQHDDGGTNLGAGSKGQFFGLGAAAFANAGAVNLTNLSNEFNLFTATGSSSRYMSCVAAIGCMSVRGADLDAAVWVGAQAAVTGSTGTYGPHVGFTYGFLITNVNGADPLYAGSTVFGTSFGTQKTVSKGIDLLGVTATNGAFISPGFKVDVNGNVQISSTAAGLELGSKTAVGSALIDFNTSGNGNDYDARIIGSGGTGVQGGGTLQVLATTFKMPTDVWFGIYTAGGDTASNGYVTIKDTAGNTRKIMTTA